VSPNSQLHLTNDSFLYACQSEFAARTKKDGSFKSHIRFESFLLDQYQRPLNATMNDFAQLVSAITAHHFQVTPQFRRHEPLNLETVSFFTRAIATLFADLETACKEMFGLGLPVIPSEPPEYSSEAPVANALLQARSNYLIRINEGEMISEPFEGFPLKELGALATSEQVMLWSCELWDTLADAIHSSFGEYADTAMAFAYWKYQELQAKPDIDWRVRPPVGEAYAKAFKPMLRNARAERGSGGDRGGRGGKPSFSDKGRPSSNRPPRESGPREHGPREHAPAELSAPRAQLPSEQIERAPSKREHSERHESKPEFKERPARREGREGREPRGGSEHRRDRADRQAPNSAPQASEKQLEDALKEVHKAIAALKVNPNLGEVALKPTNSFIRRQQHSLAVELGFDTESRGEGRDRGVVIRTSGAHV
jgi:hypothetical protein